MAIVKICFPFKKQFFDKKAAQEGIFLLGVDEVGRGCLAGPVVTAAVILKPKKLWTGKMPPISDSKAMTGQEREIAYAWLIKNSWWATGLLHHRLVDALNVYQATLHAMRRAVIQLRVAYPTIFPAAVVVDAMPLDVTFLWPQDTAPLACIAGGQKKVTLSKDHPEIQAFLKNPWQHVLHFYKGEDQSLSVAAASIIAKVTRDRIMHTADDAFPAYQFKQHKGYAVPAHQKVVTLQGRTIIHRISFRTSYDISENVVQTSIDSLYEDS